MDTMMPMLDTTVLDCGDEGLQVKPVAEMTKEEWEATYNSLARRNLPTDVLEELEPRLALAVWFQTALNKKGWTPGRAARLTESPRSKPGKPEPLSRNVGYTMLNREKNVEESTVRAFARMFQEHDVAVDADWLQWLAFRDRDRPASGELDVAKRLDQIKAQIQALSNALTPEHNLPIAAVVNGEITVIESRGLFGLPAGVELEPGRQYRAVEVRGIKLSQEMARATILIVEIGREAQSGEYVLARSDQGEIVVGRNYNGLIGRLGEDPEPIKEVLGIVKLYLGAL